MLFLDWPINEQSFRLIDALSASPRIANHINRLCKLDSPKQNPVDSQLREIELYESNKSTFLPNSHDLCFNPESKLNMLESNMLIGKF
jgi:hypothetical protein